MNRRRFITAAAASAAAVPFAEGDVVAVEIVRPRNACEALLKNIEPGHDRFPLEAEAAQISAHLKALLKNRTLPLASDFQGVSAAELRTWIDSLGKVRAARFYVLPGDRVRYEIASDAGYRVGLWKQRWVGGRLAEFAPIAETLSTAPSPLFCDITGHMFRDAPSFRQQLQVGIPAWRARLDSATGIDVHGHNGIAVGDIDADGFDEIYICQPGGLPNRLYKRRVDGTLEDITDAAGVGVLDSTASALFVDFRNIGLQDLVVLRPEGPLLFLNQGGNVFRLKPRAFLFQNQPLGSFTSMCAADYDRDGRVDLYFCSYSLFRDGGHYRYPMPYEDAHNGPPNFLFRNQLAADGTGEFVDVTDAVGLNHNNDRFSLAAAWCDYNGDGWPDLYVANDFGRKNLYRNVNGKFRDVAAEAGVEDAGAGMSASWFDYDGDGRPDLYVSNMWSDAGQRVVSQMSELWKRHPKGNSLYRNKGDGTFEETGAMEGVEMGRWAWSSGGFDFDNDGVPEIFITTGMLTNASETDLEGFFWRHVALGQSGAYEDGWNALSQAAHEQYSEAGRQNNVFYVRRGGRYQDFSGVSGLDVADDSRAFAVTDIDGDGNVDLILKSRLGPQVRVFRNDSAGSRHAIAFRLQGVQSNRDAIGARVEVDGKVRFVEAGSGYLSQHTKVLHFGLGDKTLAEKVSILWPSGVRQELGSLEAGFVWSVREGVKELSRKPFATRTAIAEKPVMGDNNPVFRDTWLIDPVPLPEKQPGPAILHLSATLPADRAAKYAVFVRYLFDLRADLKLPVWLLIDDQSRAHKIYFSEPDRSDLDRMRPALPFAGKYYTPPARDYSAMGVAFHAAGYTDEALGYLERAPQTNDRILIAIGKIHLSAGRLKQARSYLERGLALKPESADGWNTLGAVEVGEGNIRSALPQFEKALTFRPDLTSAMVNAGQAHAALGDTAKAEALFRRVLELSPNDAAAANQLGELFARQRNDREAGRWFRQAITSRRDYAPAIGNLGALYQRAGQTNDAIAAWRYGIGVAPNEESFYLNLAGVYLATSNRESARAVIEALLSRHPASAKGRQALRELESR
jgi:tetratricopeptide (TPR) repeat protein